MRDDEAISGSVRAECNYDVVLQYTIKLSSWAAGYRVKDSMKHYRALGVRSTPFAMCLWF